MSWYRRWRQAGGMYFFTVVTFERQPIFSENTARNALREAFVRTKNENPFDIIAFVLLHEHLHCLWQLPADDDDFSTRWRLIKTRFTLAMKEGGRYGGSPHFWQPRFWEHLIRDEKDAKNHLDYIHYNPVKHGYAPAPDRWPYSTFRKFFTLGEYSSEWGNTIPTNLINWKCIGE